ncbi:MAG TPA: YoaK family protein [Acidimicrobiia bacterium]
MAVLLAGITGFVDAVAFERFLGVFPANQSGNAVFLGMAIGGSRVSTEWRPATAMVGFALGIVVGELVRRRMRGPRQHRRLGAWLLVCELAFVVAVIVIAGPIERVHLIGGAKGFVLIVLASMAMGVQTEVIRHVAGTAVATTYQTGAIARMGEAVSRVLSRTARLREEREVMVLLVVLAAYVGGAAAGAAAPGEWRWSMALVAAVLAVLAGLWFVAPQRVLGDAEGPQ